MSDKIQHDIMAERQRQDELWGPPQHEHYTWLAILTEEVGEIAYEILSGGGVGRVIELRKELIQAAAVLVAWVEQLDGTVSDD